MPRSARSVTRTRCAGFASTPSATSRALTRRSGRSAPAAATSICVRAPSRSTRPHTRQSMASSAELESASGRRPPDEPYWDPYDHAIRRSPYEAWRRLRDHAPVYYNQRYGFHALSRFDDVLAASVDCATFSSAYGITLDDIGRKPEQPLMIMLDPPEH